MWCMQFIIIYDCNNYGNNNDNLDRAMNQSCSDFRIRNRAFFAVSAFGPLGISAL